MVSGGSSASVQGLLQSGFEHHQDGDLKAAERLYRRVLKRDKSNADGLYLLGTVLYQTGELRRAEKALRLAMAERPKHPETLYNLARVVMDAESSSVAAAEAETLLATVLDLQPDNVSAHRNLGVLHLKSHNPDKAQEALERAIQLDPGAAETWCDLGLAYSQTDNDDKSERAFDQALSLDPGHARARHNLGHLKLRQSRFAEGWRDYEARLLDPQAAFQHRPFDYPVWQGEDLAGKTLLVCCEQGLGDQILHASIIPDLIMCAGHVVVECEPRLVDLFRRSFPDVTVLPKTVPPHLDVARTQPDVQVSSGSLGLWLRQGVPDFPSRQSYLVGEVRAHKPSQRELRPRIGVSWKSARASVGTQKSTDISVDWAPVFQAFPDAEYVSVQYGDVQADLSALLQTHGVTVDENTGVDVTLDIDGLASCLSSLDLLITTSNTTAHLAGALGVPVWCLVPRGPGRLWYWFDGEQSSLWYASMTLYWQKSAGIWKDVFEQVASDLRDHTFSI